MHSRYDNTEPDNCASAMVTYFSPVKDALSEILKYIIMLDHFYSLYSL